MNKSDREMLINLIKLEIPVLEFLFVWTQKQFIHGSGEQKPFYVFQKWGALIYHLMQMAISLKKKKQKTDAGKDWGQEEKGITEDEIVGWHHWLKGHKFEQTSGDSEGHGSLACCNPWGCKELDTT